MKKIITLTTICLIIGWFSCSKEKQDLREFSGQKILYKDTLPGGDLSFGFRNLFGSISTVRVSGKFNFYNVNDSIRSDTIMK